MMHKISNDGFSYCPKHRKIKGSRKLKPAKPNYRIEVIDGVETKVFVDDVKKTINGNIITVEFHRNALKPTIDSTLPSLKDSDTFTDSKVRKENSPNLTSTHIDTVPLSKTVEDYGIKTRLYMKKQGGSKEMRIDDFDILYSCWHITKTQALTLAKYGGDYKGITFINREVKRGLVVIRPDGNCVMYKNVDDASIAERTSAKSIKKSISCNNPDKEGRTYMYKWYEEEIPYIERKTGR